VTPSLKEGQALALSMRWPWACAGLEHVGTQACSDLNAVEHMVASSMCWPWATPSA